MMRWIAALFALFCVFCFAPETAFAHPEDEFCTPDGGMDPELCRALAELDRPADVDRYAGIPGGEIDLDRTPLETAVRFIGIGYAHILPMGQDHILFVLALFLSTRRLWPLIGQISAFTIAHTATLGLTAVGIISPPASIIEPVIALTIAWAAVENLVFKEPSRWRPAMVFGFGLIHGMGFAGAFGELGLPPDIFWPALIGFNVGVDGGQLAVIGMALAVAVVVTGVLRRLDRPGLYRTILVWPVSVLIALIGLWWAFERIFL